MKRIAIATVMIVMFVVACRSSEQPKVSGAPAPASSAGGQYGQTLHGGLDKAKEMQEQMNERVRQMREAAKQNTPSQDE